MPPADHHEAPERVRAHAQRAAAMFAEHFHRRPTSIAAAPGRVNLIGEHTDYNQGFVLPMAIERETVIVADRTAAGVSTLVLADLGKTINVDLTHRLEPRPGTPGNHLLGVADQFHKRGFALPNLDVVVTSSVPIGAGLASSAALATAFATLLSDMLHDVPSPLDKARLCQAAEHLFAGMPCGLMDTHVAAAARAGHAMLIDCRSDTANHIAADFAAAGTSLLVIDTGVKHDLAAGAYAQRRAACEAVARLLGVPSLRSATIESLNVHGLSQEQRRRALHVIAENNRTILAAEALALGDMARLGELMLQSHASLRDLYEVSCLEVDALVDAASTMRECKESVLGSRMTGGGFGGCAIVLCEATAVDRIVDRLYAAFIDRVGRAPGQTFTTAAAAGARMLPTPD